WVRPEPVGAPLPDVAVHVVQAPGVGGEAGHRRRLLAVRPLLAIVIDIIAIVISLIGGDRPPKWNGVVVPARQAYSHSASVGSRKRRTCPAWVANHSWTAAIPRRTMLVAVSAGCPACFSNHSHNATASF